MVSQIKLGDIVVDVVLKDIKNVYLSVYPPAGRVRITAPEHLNIDTVRIFAVSKLEWIQQQQKKLQDQDRETIREYLDRESHYVWGKRYLLRIVEADGAPAVELKAGKMLLRIRPDASTVAREAIVSKWYREQLKSAIPGPAREVGADHRCKRRAGVCAENENEMGELQSRQTQHSPEYRLGQEASSLS